MDSHFTVHITSSQSLTFTNATSMASPPSHSHRVTSLHLTVTATLSSLAASLSMPLSDYVSSALAVTFAALGLAASVPKLAPGPHAVSSVHVRVPGPHGVLAQVFYPADTLGGGAETSVSASKAYTRKGVAAGVAEFAAMPRFVFDALLGRAPHPLIRGARPLSRASLVNGASTSTRTTTTTTTTPQGGPEKFPVLVFMHGLGGNCDIYSTVSAFVASFGFVVVALESEDGSGSFAVTHEGGVVAYRKPPTDLKYTRKQVVEFRAPFLAKRVSEVSRTVEFLRNPHEWTQIEDPVVRAVLGECDANNLLVGGHSFGAAATVMTVRSLPRGTFKGALLHDIWSFPLPEEALDQGLDVPTLSLLSEPFLMSGEHVYTQRLLRASKASVGFVVRGTVHSSFSDTPWWVPVSASLAKKFALRGEEDPLEVMNDIASVSGAFLSACVDPATSPQAAVQGVTDKVASRFERLTKCDGSGGAEVAVQ